MKLPLHEQVERADAQKFAVFVMLAHEAAKYSEIIPKMLLKGNVKSLLTNVINADRRLLDEVEKTIKDSVRNQLRAHQIEGDIIEARANLIWRDEWTYLEDCSEALSLVVQRLLSASREEKIQFTELVRQWGDKTLEILPPHEIELLPTIEVSLDVTEQPKD